MEVFSNHRAVETRTTYIHTDALRSPVAETNPTGAVTKRYTYEPYGAPASGTYEQGPGYTGHVADALTGLSYMQQRYDDPIAGRFLGTDPIAASPASFNRYAYANNNPYRYIDPDGRQSYEDLNLTGMAASEMLRNGEITEAEHLDAWAQGAAAGGKGLAIGATIAIPGPEDIAIAVSASRLMLAARASKGLSQALRYVESVAEKIGHTGGRSGRRTIEYSGKGGQEGADKIFNKLTGGKSEVRGESRLGSLGDGSTVQMSSRTLKDGTSETSIRIISERTGSHIKDMYKIRFKD